MAQQVTVPGRNSPFIIDAVRDMRREGQLAFIENIWREHGDVARIKIGPEKIFLIVHPDQVKEVYVTKRDVFGKGASYDGVRDLLLGQGLVTSTGDLWMRQRRLMAPFFTPTGIQQFTTLIIEEAQNLAARWEHLADTGEEVDMLAEMSSVAGNIILRTMFSMEGEANDDLRQAFNFMLGFMADNMHAPISLPLWVPTKANRTYHESIKMANDYVYGLIAERRSVPEDAWPNDLLTKLMTTVDEETGERMSNQQLRDEMMTIYLAGYETTARTLMFTWYALHQNPAVAAALHDELDASLSGGFGVQALKGMPYTLYVIKETLRLYPAAPLFVRDAFADDELGGVPIPEGARVMLSPYLTHRHPAFWPNPERFDPLRWTPEAESDRHSYAFHAFAGGARICLGNNFSLLESHILLASLAHRFTPRLREGHVPEVVMEGTLTSANGMPMTIHRR